MALKIGSLYYSVSARTSGLIRGMDAALKSVERFTREAKKVGQEMGQLSIGLAAVGGAALKLAAEVDGPTKAALDDLKKSTQQLALPIAQTLLPAVKALTKDIRSLAAWVNGLDPQLKKNAATVAKWAVEIGAMAFVAGKAAGLVGTFAGVVRGLLGALAALPLLPIVVGLAAIAVGVALVHKAWRENWSGIQEKTAKVIEWLGNAFGKVVEFIGGLFKALVGQWAGMVDGILDMVDALQRLTGTKLVDVGGLREGFRGLFKDLADGSFFKVSFDFGKDVGTNLVEGVLDEWKLIGEKLKKLLPKGLFDKGEEPPLPGEVEVSPVGRGPGLKSLNFGSLARNAPAAAPSFGFVRGPSTLDMLRRAGEAVAGALSFVGSQLLAVGLSLVQKMGRLGNVANSAIQGAQAGGWVGAVLAVVAELYSMSSSFDTLVNIAEGLIGTVLSALAPMFDMLTKALGPILGGAGLVLASALQAIAPLFDIVGQALTFVAPFLALVAALLGGLAPIIKIFADILTGLLNALQPVIEVLFTIARMLLLGIVGIAKQVLDIWNALVGAVASIVDTAVSVITFGAVQGAGNFIRAMQVGTGGMADAIKALENMSWDSATALAVNAAANYEAAGAAMRLNDAAQEVAESFQNMPSGYRVALARYNATEAVAGAQVPGFGGGGSSLATIGGSAFTVMGDVVIQTSGDGEETLEALKEELKKERVRNRGNPAPRDGDL